MPALRDLQREFAAYLVTGEARALTGDVAAARVTAAQCLNIHRNNVSITLREALAAVYPVVQQLVGEAFFADVARNYLRDHPCRSGNLHDFGNALPSALAADARLAELPYLADVAALEWAYHEVFHGARADPVDPARLQQWRSDQFAELYFVLHPGVRLLSSEHPIVTIWEAHQGAPLVHEIDLGIGAEHVLLTRPRLSVQLHRLVRADYAFLASLLDGATLEWATEAAVACDGEFDLQSRLTTFVTSGLIVDVHD